MGNAVGGKCLIFAGEGETVREKEERLMPDAQPSAETTLLLKRIFKL